MKDLPKQARELMEETKPVRLEPGALMPDFTKERSIMVVDVYYPNQFYHK